MKTHDYQLSPKSTRGEWDHEYTRELIASLSPFAGNRRAATGQANADLGGR